MKFAVISSVNLSLKNALLLLITISCVSLSSKAQPKAGPLPRLDLETFMKVVKTNWQEKVAEKERLPKIEIGAIQYLPPEVLKASQQEFTFIKIIREIAEAESLYRTKYDEAQKKFIFSFDNGRSALPAQKAAIGILHRGKIHLLDGHHKVLISLFMNAETLPVRVIADWSDLSAADFRAKMIESRYAYPYDKDGQPIERFYNFDEMTDNPNLYLARLLIQKVKGGIELEKFNIFSVSGAKKPLILKFNEGLPFVEYFIAKLLAEHDIFYDPEWNKKVPKKIRKQIRTILEIEQAKENSPLRDVILVDPELEINSLDPAENQTRVSLIFRHFQKYINCDEFLSPTYQVQTID